MAYTPVTVSGEFLFSVQDIEFPYSLQPQLGLMDVSIDISNDDSLPATGWGLVATISSLPGASGTVAFQAHGAVNDSPNLPAAINNPFLDFDRDHSGMAYGETRNGGTTIASFSSYVRPTIGAPPNQDAFGNLSLFDGSGLVALPIWASEGASGEWLVRLESDPAVTGLSYATSVSEFNSHVPGLHVDGTIRIRSLPSCDLDENTLCNAKDIDLLSSKIRTGDLSDLRFDLDRNGKINQDDRLFWVRTLMNTWIGDANLDGEFNSSDFVRVFQEGQYEDNIRLNSGWLQGDWSGDGEFTSSDFVLAFVEGGYERGPRPLVLTPEPNSLLLLAIVLGIVFGRRNLA